MRIPDGIVIYKDSFPLLHVSVVYCSKYRFPVILFFPVFYYFFTKYGRCFFSSVLLFLQNFFEEDSHMTQSVSERISYFRTMLLETARIPSWHYSAAFSLIESSCSWEMELKNFFLLESGALLKQIQENCSQSSDPAIPFSFTDGLNFSWMILPFPEKDAFSYYVLGPVFATDVSEEYFRRQLDVRNMSLSSQVKFMQLLKTIPVIPMTNFGLFARMFYYTCFEKNISFAQFHTLRPSHMKKSSGEVSHSSKQALFQSQDIPSTHGTYLLEQRRLSHVENGNIFYTPASDDFFSQNAGTHVPGTLCPGNPLRQAKDELIVSITLVTRAAIRGGMIPETAFSLSDHYIQAAENCPDQDGLADISDAMYHDFTWKVHELKQQPGLSPAVQACRTYIQKHLNEPFSLEDIARDSGYTPYYLSSLFKKETGCTLKNYVASEKLEAAKLLLKNTSLSISEISDRLHFTNPSYFSALFKKQMGMTPTEYIHS